MLSRDLLPHVRRKLREGIVGLPESEPVDLVFMASVLCNFNPFRMMPHWLVIVSGPASGKTRLVETIQPWTRFVFTVVTGITPGFWLSTKKTGKISPLERVQSKRQRILLSRDATGFTSINPNTADQVYAQLRDIHDGHMYRETGLTNDPKSYEPLPEERLGWIVAATPDWYGFQRRHHDLGSRFSIYYYDGFRDWSSIADLVELNKLNGAKDAEVKADMSSAVIQFMETAIAHMRDLPDVVLPDACVTRIAAAIRLTMRLLSTGDHAGDTGNRLLFRSREMACMLAFMHGRKLVDSTDVDVVLRFIFSQLPVEPQKFVQYSVLRGGGWVTVPELMEYASGKRRTWEVVLGRMMDVGVVDGHLKKGFSGAYRYRFSKPARELVEKVALNVPKGKSAPVPKGPEGLEELIAEEAEKLGLVV